MENLMVEAATAHTLTQLMPVIRRTPVFSTRTVTTIMIRITASIQTKTKTILPAGTATAVSTATEKEAPTDFRSLSDE